MTTPLPSSPVQPRTGATAGSVVLDVRDLTVHYGGVRALEAVSLTVRAGQVVGLIGPNGAGKTTLIDAVTGFTGHRGTVRFEDQPVDGLGAHARARRGMARTWQSMELFDDLTVRDNVRVAVEPASLTSVLRDLVRPTRAQADDVVNAALASVGLGGAGDAAPRQLSLGQQKMVGVARAVAAGPAVVLLDEPAAGLDTMESRVLGDQLRRLAAAGPGVLLVDHDMGLVLDVCDFVYVIEFGRIIASGPPAAVRNDTRVIEAYLGSSSVEDVPAVEAVP